METSAGKAIGQRQDRIARYAIAGFAALFIGFALFNVPSEFAAHKARVDGARAPYRAEQPDLGAKVASVEGVYAKLEICNIAMTDILTLLESAEKRNAVAQECLKFVDGLLQKSPALTTAQIVKALALNEIGDSAAARQALLLSEASAGNAIPNAQRRAAVWSKQFLDLSEPELAALGRDFARLAGHTLGITWLATVYSGNSDVRPLITEVMQTMPNATQAEFLGAVRVLSK